MASLRRAFFACGNEAAIRYGISFDRVVQHLWEARQAHRRLLLRSVSHVEDLVHAVACVDGVGLAWADLAERYEPALVRACKARLNEIEAILFVRRLFADLRHRNGCQPSSQHPSLRGYAGVRPLRNWLGDRLLGGLNRESLDKQTRAVGSRSSRRDAASRLPWIWVEAKNLVPSSANSLRENFMRFGLTPLRLAACDGTAP